MSVEQLEKRVAALEAEVFKLRHGPAEPDGGSQPTANWAERLGHPPSDDEKRAYEESAPYRAYIRRTGTTPPPDWKPGDPIPEPDHWR